jgi:hypothetical protein
MAANTSDVNDNAAARKIGDDFVTVFTILGRNNLGVG